MNKTQHLKDPGSAITHFIGMLMAICGAIPLLIKAAHEPGRVSLISLAVYAISLILLYAASTTYHTFDISAKVNTILKKIDHMMIFILIAGSYTPICLITLKGRTGLILLSIVWGIAIVGILIKAFCLLPEMGIFHSLYRNGMDLRTGFHTDFLLIIAGGIWLAFSRGNHLHNRRYYLRIKASDLQ